jgi:hypothetical protein
MLFSQGGDLINSVPVDTGPSVSETDAGMLFHEQIARDQEYRDSLNSFASRGFTAELGFFDLNAGISYAKKQFVLAWKVNVANGREFPCAYVRADFLQLIGYMNGVIIG